MSNKIVGIRADRFRVQLDSNYEYTTGGTGTKALLCAAKSLGIKKTQMRRKLNFFCMTEDQIRSLAKSAFTSKLREEHYLLPLVIMDESDYDDVWARFSKAEDKKTETPGRYDFTVVGEHCLYKSMPTRLGKMMLKKMSKLTDDPKKIRKICEIQDDIGTKKLKKVGTRTYFEYVLNRQKVKK